MSTHANLVKHSPYYRDLYHRYGSDMAINYAESIARWHGTSLSSLREEEGLQILTHGIANGATQHVSTLALVLALGY